MVGSYVLPGAWFSPRWLGVAVLGLVDQCLCLLVALLAPLVRPCRWNTQRSR